MTIRTRLTLTQVMTGAVVIALCVLAINLTHITGELAGMPAMHVSWLGRVHDLFDSVGQAVKDLDDIAKGEDDSAELGVQLERAHAALADLRRGMNDDITRELVRELEAGFAELQRGEAEVVAHARSEDFAAAGTLAFSLGEELYEERLRPVLERIEERAVAIARAIGEQGASRARTSLIAAVLLVVIGAIATAVGTVIVLRIRRRLSALAATADQIGGDVQHVRSRDVIAGDELGDLGRAFNRMADDVARLIEMTAAKEALAFELALAARMQQALLPPSPTISGLEISGAMSAMTQVGGDYYDVLPARDGAWLAIGDVSGHGFNTGIVTVLAQSAIASVTRALPDAAPGEVLQIVNDVLHELVRVRLGLPDHMTLTLLRYHDDGTIEFAGAHQEIIVRATDGTARAIETTGPWLAVVPDISKYLVADRFELAEGETMLLFTDGVVEARVDGNDMFGFERLVDTVTALPANAPAQAVRDAVFSRVLAAAPRMEDDATVLAVRRLASMVTTRIAS